MNLTEKINILESYSTRGSSFGSKISHVLNVCERTENLMIGIYLVEKNHFFYCNSKLKAAMGDRCSKLMEGGWDFWYSLINPNELASTRNQISNYFTPPYIQDLLTLKYHITIFRRKNICMKHEILLHRLEQHLLAINYFFDVSEKEKIEHCFDASPKAKRSRSSKTILSISPREKQVLRLISDGYSSKEIANMLYISNHTAISHRKNLIEKFQVKNTAHLIKKASGLICL